MEDAEQFLSRLVEDEGYSGATHLLAAAIEKWADDEGEGEDSDLRAYAAKLRELAGPID
jgi:hypothetical protein